MQGQVIVGTSTAAAAGSQPLQIALQFLSDRPLKIQLLPSNTNISLPCSWEKVGGDEIGLHLHGALRVSLVARHSSAAHGWRQSRCDAA
jgi:hypothetical protein